LRQEKVFPTIFRQFKISVRGRAVVPIKEGNIQVSQKRDGQRPAGETSMENVQRKNVRGQMFYIRSDWAYSPHTCVVW